MDKSDRDFFISIGICPHCKKRPLEPNRKMCYECLGRERDRYYARKNSGILDEQSKKKNAKKMDIYYARKEQGICTRCGKRNAEHGLLCKRCHSTYKNRRNARKQDIDRSERISYGLCYICGEPVLDGKKVCAKCYEVRMRTMPAMFSHPCNEYFRRLNSMIFNTGKEKT